MQFVLTNQNPSTMLKRHGILSKAYIIRYTYYFQFKLIVTFNLITFEDMFHAVFFNCMNFASMLETASDRIWDGSFFRTSAGKSVISKEKKHFTYLILNL